MPIPNKAASTELDAVNQILSSVGQAAVTTLDMQNPEVFAALSTLRQVSRQLQAEGWTFNTELMVGFEPDTVTKQIEVPVDVLQMDINKTYHGDAYDLVRRRGVIYDRYNHTDIFQQKLYFDVVWLFQFEDLPTAFQSHIIARASRIVATKLVGDSELVQLLALDEELTQAALMEYETNQGDYTMFGFRQGQSHYNSYQPFQALIR